jgi:peptidoglycan/LPS O-acetylase OafA/YrhL
MDSVRGIALIAVVLTHVTFFTALKGGETTQVRFGYISATIFFMLSAFLLYGPWLAERLADGDRPSVLAYAWRRVLRVVPAYYVALTAIALALGLSYVFTVEGVATLYGFVQSYRVGWELRGLSQAWTLCVEALFYVLLPVWAALMRRVAGGPRARRIRVELAGCAGLFAVSLAYKVVITGSGALDGRYAQVLQLNILTFLDDFAVGMALAVLVFAARGRSVPTRAERLIDERPWVPWAVAAAAVAGGSAAFGLLGQAGDVTETWAPYLVRHYVIEVIALGLILPAIFGDPRRGWVRRILGNRVLLYMGMVSYGAYLWHLGILTQLDRWDFGELAGNSSLVWSLAVFVLALAFASLSYYLVERPFLKLKGRVRGRPPPRSGESITDPAPVAPTRP